MTDTAANTDLEALLMPGAGRPVRMFDGIIPEDIRRSLEERIAQATPHTDGDPMTAHTGSLDALDSLSMEELGAIFSDSDNPMHVRLFAMESYMRQVPGGHGLLTDSLMSLASQARLLAQPVVAQEVVVVRVRKNGEIRYATGGNLLSRDGGLTDDPLKAQHFDAMDPAADHRLKHVLSGINHPGRALSAMSGIKADAAPEVVRMQIEVRQRELEAKTLG